MTDVMVEEPPLYYLIAGEPSGDVIGARLMRALRQRLGGRVRFAGVGGEQMAVEGLESLLPIRELAIMGMVEILPQIFNLIRRIRETIADIEAKAPVAVVTIDSSGFCFRVTEKIKLKSPRPVLVHYVAPMVWAWRAHRARSAAKAADHLLTLLPFEPPYFEHVKLPASYVGHPVIEGGADHGDGPAFRARHGIAPDATVLCMLPGSRKSEVSRLLPVFRETVERLRQRHSDLVVVVPTVETVANRVAEAIADWSGRTILVRGSTEKFDAFAASTAALAASGTVALELAMARVPMVIGYRIWGPTHFVVSRTIKIKYATLINLLLDRPMIPELLQHDCTPERLADAVERLLSDPDARRLQIEGSRAALQQIGRDGEAPSLRAADKVLELVAAADRRKEGRS
ncbi:lipid-A-disaccharide synthase [Aliidongia dinghuensis]|uniref:Lipid-A-disaccharide synthase n=1 Tax=Aliidongia dinghuensis TaxID=1867774 RepID=A0A8J2Z033_9PROT|nr:lipid-A-disaccharide synthase [Aliidongia dinghuensis]GGF40347.1 lipid-A-disaccharide synthase [Aliidongia dinghuensis]